MIVSQKLSVQGVLIETAEERRRKEVARIMNEDDTNESDTPETTISYIMIPHDRSKPLEELQMTVPSSQKAGDALANHLKQAFVGGSSSVDLSLLQPTHHLGSSTMPADDDATAAAAGVSEETLKKVAAKGHVEVFSLVHAVPSNRFTAVNIYLDEVGMLKRLPLNSRATELAAKAGYNPPPQFYGDVFLGRVRTKPTLGNLSIKVGADTAPNAAWLQKATMENLEYQTALNSITGKQNETQPAIDGEGGVAKREDGYSWTQTEEELEMVVQTPEGTAAKEVKIKFLPQSMRIQHRGNELLGIKLFERIDPDGCTWTLEASKDGGKQLVVTMEKVEQALWPRIKD